MGDSYLDAGGGFPAMVEEEVQRLLHEVCSFYLVLLSLFTYFFSMVLYLSLTFVTDPVFPLFFRVWICCRELVHSGKRPSSWKQRGCKRLNQQWQDWRQRDCMGS